MKFNLDEVYSRIEPWELVITVDGADRAVRRLSNVDMEQLRRFGTLSPDEARRLIAELFEESHRPDVSGWDELKAVMVLSNVIAYYRELAKKKVEDAAAAPARAMARTTGRTSDPEN